MDRLIVRVRRGHNLDATARSNPHVLIKIGRQKLKTQWNQDSALSISDPYLPVQLFVYDKNKFFNGKMGEAKFEVNPFLEAVKTLLEDGHLQDDKIITTIEPDRQNCLVEESQIVLKNGKVVQNVLLRVNNAKSRQVELQLSMEYWCGVLKVHVQKGLNLAIRDVISRSSDPYVILKMGDQQVKTRVVKRNLNPQWNEELTLYIPDPPLPIQLYVYDRDTLSPDDKMGEAEFDINPIVEAVKRGLNELPHGNTIRTIKAGRQNHLVQKSKIVWEDGQVVQNMALRLQNVESGEVELKLIWKLPSSKSL